MLTAITHRREDGTLVGIVKGLPYHVLPSDHLWSLALEMAAEMGDALPLDAPPAASEAPPQPTKMELMAKLAAIQAQIDGLPD